MSDEWKTGWDSGEPDEFKVSAGSVALPTKELLLALAERLSRRVANERHGEDCGNCKADRELVLMARAEAAKLPG